MVDEGELVMGFNLGASDFWASAAEITDFVPDLEAELVSGTHFSFNPDAPAFVPESKLWHQPEFDFGSGGQTRPHQESHSGLEGEARSSSPGEDLRWQEYASPPGLPVPTLAPFGATAPLSYDMEATTLELRSKGGLPDASAFFSLAKMGLQDAVSKWLQKERLGASRGEAS